MKTYGRGISKTYAWLLVIAVQLVVMPACNLFTGRVTPPATVNKLLSSEQISRIQTESLFLSAGGLHPKYEATKAVDTVPERYKDDPAAKKQASESFMPGGSWAGDVSVFLYDKQADIDLSYGKDTSTSESVPDLGEKVRLISFSMPYSGGTIDGVDLTFVRCSAVVKMRIITGTVTKDDVIAYARRLDNGLKSVACNAPADATNEKPAPTAKPAPPPTNTPVAKTGIPVVKMVQLTEDTSSGSLVIYQEIYFSDSEGDVNWVDYEVVSSTNPNVQVEGGMVDIPSSQQKAGTHITGEWGCGGGNYTVTLRVILTDKAGNRSEPKEYKMICTAN